MDGPSHSYTLNSDSLQRNDTMRVQSNPEETNSSLELIYYIISTISVIFWIVIWIMHICALTNAKLKLNKRSCSSAATKRKRKLLHLKERFLPSKSLYHNRIYSMGSQIDRNCNNNIHCDQQGNLDKSPLQNQHPYGNSQDMRINSATQIDIARDQNGVDQQLQVGQDKTDYSYINLPLPGVSIIKPLVGIDINLRANLETFFVLDYPTYELLFCIQEPEDEAITLVKSLLAEYPTVDARLFIGGSKVGVNPKINNMQPAYEAVKYEFILISDSGISMQRDTLLDMVNHMHDDIALVHQMPFVCDNRPGFHSIVEKVYFGTAHARAYLTADLLNINCPTGMSALMRKNLLDEVGGIKEFGQYLAEDFFFAKSFTDRGWKICISSQPALQNAANESDNIGTLNSRIQRWIKLRFAMVPQWTLLEPFSECMLLGLLGALSISFLWALNPIAIFLFHVVIWFLCDYKLLCTIQGGPLKISKTELFAAWLVRESTAFFVFLKALASSKVTWRSRRFKLKKGGLAEEIP